MNWNKCSIWNINFLLRRLFHNILSIFFAQFELSNANLMMNHEHFLQNFLCISSNVDEVRYTQFKLYELKINSKILTVNSSQLVTRNVVTVNYVDAWVKWWMIFIRWLHNVLYKWFSISSHVRCSAHMLNTRFVTWSLIVIR